MSSFLVFTSIVCVRDADQNRVADSIFWKRKRNEIFMLLFNVPP